MRAHPHGSVPYLDIKNHIQHQSALSSLPTAHWQASALLPQRSAILLDLLERCGLAPARNDFGIDRSGRTWTNGIDTRAPPRARSSPATLRLSLGQASRFSPRRRCRPAAVPPHRRPSRPLACPPSRTAAHTVAIFADGGVVCVQRFMLQDRKVFRVCVAR